MAKTCPRLRVAQLIQTGWPSPLIAPRLAHSGLLHHGHQRRKPQTHQSTAARAHCSPCKVVVTCHLQARGRRRPTAASRRADPSSPFRRLRPQAPCPRPHKIRSEYRRRRRLDKGGRQRPAAATVPTPSKYLRHHRQVVDREVPRLLSLAVDAAPVPSTYHHRHHSPWEAWCPRQRAPLGATKISRTRTLRHRRLSHRRRRCRVFMVAADHSATSRPHHPLHPLRPLRSTFLRRRHHRRCLQYKVEEAVQGDHHRHLRRHLHRHRRVVDLPGSRSRRLRRPHRGSQGVATILPRLLRRDPRTAPNLSATCLPSSLARSTARIRSPSHTRQAVWTCPRSSLRASRGASTLARKRLPPKAKDGETRPAARWKD